MTTLAMRKSVVDGMTAKQRQLIKFVLSRIDLGEPATYKTPANVLWYVFDGDMIELEDLAALGTFAANFSRISNWNQPKLDDGTTDFGAVRVAMRQFLKANMKLDTPPDDEPNPWQWTLTNNGAPAAVQAGPGVPDTWVPV